MTVAQAQDFVAKKFGEDVYVTLSCRNCYEINKTLPPDADCRGKSWTAPVRGEWQCPHCGSSYFLKVEGAVTAEGNELRCPHGYNSKTKRWDCPHCKSPCQFICLECGLPLRSVLERSGHNDLTGHTEFKENWHHKAV